MTSDPYAAGYTFARSAFTGTHPGAKGRTYDIIGASLSEPLLDELAGALFWYIYIYIYIYYYIYLYPQSILVPREPPVNAQRANVKPAE